MFQSSNRTIFRNDSAVMSPHMLPANYTAERIAPTFLPSRESHVTVPLLRSLITGGFFGLSTGVVVAYISLLGKAGTWYSIEVGIMAGSIVFFGASFLYWLYITGQYDSLLSRVETVTGLDIDRDGEVGNKPEPRQIQVKIDEKARWQFADLPGDERAVYEFARDVVSGRVTFSEKGAADSGYSVDNFRQLRDIFIARHWAEWKDPASRKQGVMLYRAGKTILAHIAEVPPESDDTGLMSPHQINGQQGDQWS